MKLNITDAQKLLASRAEDYLRMADRGELVCGNFLTPSEAAYVAVCMKELGAQDRFFLFGGYKVAERKRLFVLPSFLSDIDGESEEKARAYFPDDLSNSIKAVKIQGSGYRTLSHRDYLGSVLALGIERSSLGDICILGDSTAMLFCTDAVMPLILSELTAIGRDGVRVTEAKLDVNMPSTQKYQAFTDTVASERLDCVVASLCNLSRERAQNLIRAGLVEHNYECALKIDVRVNENDVISARGFGKFIILPSSVDDISLVSTDVIVGACTFPNGNIDIDLFFF